VDAEAGRYGVHFDGPTLAEATGFGFTCLREDLPHLLEVLLEMVFHPRLEPAAIEGERRVVLGAVNQESDYPAWELTWARRVYRLRLCIQACHPETAATLLRERSLWGETQDFAWLEERLEKVEPEELGRLARRIFGKGNCYVGLIGPEVEWDPWEFTSCLS